MKTTISLLEKLRCQKWTSDYQQGVKQLEIMQETHADLLEFARWTVGQLQGDSGAGHNYWEQFPEYLAGLNAISKAKGQP